MIKTTAKLGVTVAFVGAIIIYHEHFTAIVRQTADVIRNMGTGGSVEPPKIELPSVADAIARGKGKGARHVETVLKDAKLGELVKSPSADGLVELATGLAATSTGGPTRIESGSGAALEAAPAPTSSTPAEAPAPVVDKKQPGKR